MNTDATHSTKVRRPGWGLHARWATPLAALIILIPLAAACSGGSSGPSVAKVESTPTPANESSSNDSTEPSELAYSQCMRDQGISNFPDPGPGGELQIDANALGIEPNSPQFQAADEACKHLLPAADEGQRPDRETILKYSQCMRDQGISDFPDPNPEGGLEIQAEPGGSLDPNSPQFQAAHEACKQYLPGSGVDSSFHEEVRP